MGLGFVLDRFGQEFDVTVAEDAAPGAQIRRGVLGPQGRQDGVDQAQEMRERVVVGCCVIGEA